MKKYLFLLLCSLAIVSCTEQKIVYQTSNQSFTYTINAWDYTNMVDQQGTPYANNYFYKRVNVPELTREMVLNGNIQVYRVHYIDTPNEYLHILPEVQHNEELQQDGSYKFYTQTIDAIYGEGWIEFAVYMSDFFYEDDLQYVPEIMNFQVVLTR